MNEYGRVNNGKNKRSKVNSNELDQSFLFRADLAYFMMLRLR